MCTGIPVHILFSQTSCKSSAIELALIAEVQPMVIMQSMINLKPQTSNLKPQFFFTFVAQTKKRMSRM